MTPEIIEQIKKKAEGKYPEPSGNKQQVVDMNYPARKAYTTGQIEAIEMMIGFIEWVNKNNYLEDNGYWYYDINQIKRYSTIELLTKYIKEVLSK